MNIDEKYGSHEDEDEEEFEIVAVSNENITKMSFPRPRISTSTKLLENCKRLSVIQHSKISRAIS